ncbi:MAG: GDSL-type esterase/lipase family protein [Acidimicrobiia bacterium]
MLVEGGRLAGADRIGVRARARAGERPAQSFAAGLAATLAGVGLLAWAVRSSAVGYGVAGVLLTTVGLWLVNERVRAWADRRPRPFLAAAVGLLAAGAAAMALAFAAEAAWLAGLALVLVVGGLLPAGALLRRATRRGWIGGVPAGLALGLASPWAASRPLGALLALAGLALCRRGLRRALAEPGLVRWATWTGVATAAGGAVVLVLASRLASSGAAFSGAVLLAFGVMAMSEGWPRLGLRPVPPVAVAALGAVLLVVGAYVLVGLRLKIPVWPALAVAGIVALAGASFVMRGEGLLVVVVVGLVSVWVLLDRSDEASTDPNPGAAGRIVALGDSYISGEGSPTYFAGTNVRGEDENECRRSPSAFPYLVARRLGMALDFFACSGAKAAQLHSPPGQEPASPPGVPGALPQLDNLPADVSRVEVALVSIGGNDARFGDVGQGCTLPGSCDALREMWLANLDQVGPKITRAFEQVKARLPGVPVVAIPYPLMLTERSCGWSVLHDAEHEFLSEFVTVLNDRIRVSAANAGVNFFEDQLFAYDGARICDGDGPDDTVMNFLSFSPVEGSFPARVNPRNWIHGSLHPKPEGHRRTAELLAPFVEALVADVGAGRRPANPAPDPGARFRLRNVGSARPVLARPDRLPPGLGCPAGQHAVSPVASSVLLFDERSSFVLDAVPGSPVCFTRPDGTWAAELPGSPGGDVILDDGVVRVRPAVPEAAGHQQVVYEDRELGWHLRTVRFCSRQESCPASVGAFLNAQLADAARELALPVLLLFVGGWLSTIGLSRRSLTEDVARAAGGGRGVAG